MSSPARVGGQLLAARVVQLAAGEQHTLALCEAGDVYSWGYGVDGCLGTYQTETDRPTPGIIEHLEEVHALK